MGFNLNKKFQTKLLKRGTLGYLTYKVLLYISRIINTNGACFLNDRQFERRVFKKVFGRYPDLDNPETLNEKIQWLKLNCRKDFHTQCCDKFLVRDYIIKKIGPQVRENLIPLLFVTSNWRDITFNNLPDIPFIIKATHTSGDYMIVRDKKEVDINLLQGLCRYWLHRDYYSINREWQYKNCPRRIIVEQLLQDKNGQIPNDYKLHYINGQLQFVYCSIGREGKNYRKIYSPDWKPLPFIWLPKSKLNQQCSGEDIQAPSSFELMKQYGDIIAKDFDYVRVDFYDVDGHLYFGEITLHHGNGHDVFYPEEYDLFYGNKLKLSNLS